MDAEGDSVWSKKWATLSDKSACKEFGLTQEEIVTAIRKGKLQYRMNSIYGNPFVRLVRSEVEKLVDEKHSGDYLRKKKLEKELAQVNKELKMLSTRVASLEKHKAEPLAMLGK